MYIHCIYMSLSPFFFITFELDMIKTQIGFQLKAEMLFDNIWGMSPLLKQEFHLSDYKVLEKILFC